MIGPDKIAQIAANPAQQAEYGPLLDFYRQRLNGYHTVVIMSEREHGILLEQKIGIDTHPDKIRAALKEALPYVAVDEIFKDDVDLRVFMAGVSARRGGIFNENGQTRMDGGGAVALQMGSEAAPLRIGLISLPLTSPATLAAMAPLLNGDRSQRESTASHQRDLRMYTAGHEIYHLIDFAERNAVHYSGHRSANMTGVDQKDEVYADRAILADMPALVAAGIIRDPMTGLDIIAARRLETMQGFVLSRVEGGPGQGAILLEQHAIGFSLTSRDGLDAQQQRVRAAGTEIRSIFRTAIQNAYDEAAEGKAPAHVQQAYQQSEADYAFMRRLYPPENAAQDQLMRLSAFTQSVMNSPEFMHSIASQIRNMPSASPESAGMAGDFVSAYERLVKPQPPAPKAAEPQTPAQQGAAPVQRAPSTQMP